MASKILVGLPQHGTFSTKKHEELFSVGYVGSQTTNPETRIKQLEQNIRFLQEQHQVMLSGLHREIETLRRRNRDLQFQMVFPKGGVAVLQTSSPEDDRKLVAITPGSVNITPLQIELLERDLADLKTNLSESRTKNVYLQGVIDEQKKTIQALKAPDLEIAANGKAIQLKEKKPVELEEKLEDADRMIRRLRRENEEQRKEIISLRTTSGKNLPREGGNHRQRQNQSSQTSRFPPLNINNHWNKNDKRRDGEQSSTSLPLLKERTDGPTTGQNFSYHHGGHRRGYPHHQRGSRIYRNNYRDQQD